MLIAAISAMNFYLQALQSQNSKLLYNISRTMQVICVHTAVASCL